MTVRLAFAATVTAVTAAFSVGVVAAVPQAQAVTSGFTGQVLAEDTMATAAVVTIVSPRLFGMHDVGLDAAPLSMSSAAGLGPRAGSGSVNLLGAGAEWAIAQPHEGTAPDFTRLERAVKAALAHGTSSPMAQLFGTPAWAGVSGPRATPRAGLPAGWTAPPRRDAWRAYVRAIATRFKGRIGAYSVWPEANLGDLWGGTTAQLADLTLDAYRVIKAVDPAAKVVSASTGLRQRGWTIWYRSYLLELKSRGWPADVFAFHGYTASMGTPVTRQGLISQFKGLLAATGAPRREVWDGEVNWGVAGPGAANPHVRMDGDWRAAAYTSRTMLDSLRQGVSRVYWSAWMPAFPAGIGYGVTFYPGTRGAKGLKTTYDWVVGKHWGGCTYLKGLVTCAVSSGRAVWKIRWSETTAKRVVVTRGYTRVCTLENGCRTVGIGKVVTISGAPVRMGT